MKQVQCIILNTWVFLNITHWMAQMFTLVDVYGWGFTNGYTVGLTQIDGMVKRCRVWRILVVAQNLKDTRPPVDSHRFLILGYFFFLVSSSMYNLVKNKLT